MQKNIWFCTDIICYSFVFLKVESEERRLSDFPIIPQHITDVTFGDGAWITYTLIASKYSQKIEEDTNGKVTCVYGLKVLLIYPYYPNWLEGWMQSIKMLFFYKNDKIILCCLHCFAIMCFLLFCFVLLCFLLFSLKEKKMRWNF